MKPRLVRYLRRHVGEDGSWFGSKAEVARALGVTLSPVQKAFAALLREGKIQVVTQGGGRGHTTVYELVGSVPKHPSQEPPQSSEANSVQTPFPRNSVSPAESPVPCGQTIPELLGFPPLRPAPAPARTLPTHDRRADTVSPVPRSPSSSSSPWPPPVVQLTPLWRWDLTDRERWIYTAYTLDYGAGMVQIFRKDGTLGYRVILGGFPLGAGGPDQLVAELRRLEQAR